MTNVEIALTVVAKITGVCKSKILSATRIWPAVEARQLIILLLSQDGATDDFIALNLKRHRCSVLHSRHNALNALEVSRHFRDKFYKALSRYELQKSLRVS